MKTHRFWYVLKGMRASALQKQNVVIVSKMCKSFSCNNINNNLIFVTIIKAIIIIVVVLKL